MSSSDSYLEVTIDQSFITPEKTSDPALYTNNFLKSEIFLKAFNKYKSESPKATKLDFLNSKAIIEVMREFNRNGSLRYEVDTTKLPYAQDLFSYIKFVSRVKQIGREDFLTNQANDRYTKSLHDNLALKVCANLANQVDPEFKTLFTHPTVKPLFLGRGLVNMMHSQLEEMIR